MTQPAPSHFGFPSIATASSSNSSYNPSPASTSTSEPSFHESIDAHASISAATNPYDNTPFSSTATPSSSYFSNPLTSPPLSHLDEIPKLGSIRCYWTILSPSLDFMYLDPILEHHLGEYARTFVRSNLLDFVHPDERSQLAEDLLPKPDRIAGVETAGVFGSVTRLRYSRLVGILRKMGCLEVPTLPDADKYALDADYLNLDLTTSWIAGNGITRGKGPDVVLGELGQGAVLAFFHVVGDKDHVKNNDLMDRGDWTNWCGVQVDEHAYFTPSRCSALVDVLERITSSSSRPSTAGTSEEDSKSALIASLHGLSSETTDGPPPHVFQILDRNGKTIVSFPTPEDKNGKKRYEVEAYAALAREVVARPRGAANANTSCTKRYRSKHPVMKDSILTTIESVVIQYGSITFACFQTGGIYLTSARKAALGLNQSSISNLAPSSAVTDFNLEDVPARSAKALTFPQTSNKRTSPYLNGTTRLESSPGKRIKSEMIPSRPLLSVYPSTSTSTGSGLSISTATSRGSYRPSLESEYGANGGISPTVASASAILGLISSNHSDPPSSNLDKTLSQTESHSPYLGPPPSSYSQVTTASDLVHFPRGNGHSPASLYPPSSTYSPHVTSPYQSSYANHNGYFPPTLPYSITDPSQDSKDFKKPAVPVSLLPSAPTSNQADQAAIAVQLLGDESNATKVEKPTTNGKEGKKGRRERPEGPVFKPGLKACESCGTINSPEWRKGPSGSKSLCNACGLRYARTVSRQKKLAEQAANGVPVKKRKSKASSFTNSITTTTTPVVEEKPAAASTSTLPATSSAHTNQEPAFSRAESAPVQKPYTPYYTSGPQLSGSYALVAAQAPTSIPLVSSAPLYPVSTSGYYPMTSTYAHSTYPPSSTPILTHIPIHHTLAATLAPLSAPLSMSSHDYSRSNSAPTSLSHSPFSHMDHLHALSQAPSNNNVHSQQGHTSSGGGSWQPHYTSTEIGHPVSYSVSAASMTSFASATLPITSQATSPHLNHSQPLYQPFQPWGNADQRADNGIHRSHPPFERHQSSESNGYGR